MSTIKIKLNQIEDLNIPEGYYYSDTVMFTGTTALTVYHIVALPLDMGENSSFKVEFMLRKAGAGYVGNEVYISTSNTIINGGSIGVTGGSHAYFGFERTYILRGTNIIEGFNFITIMESDRVKSGLTRSTQPWAPRDQQLYLWFTGTPSATTVQMILEHLSITYTKNI